MIDPDSVTNVFTVKHWTSSKANDVYVFFNGDTKTKKDTIYKDKKTKHVHYIDHIIDTGITVQQLKYTISKYCDFTTESESNEMYLWGTHSPNTDYLIHFLKSVFSKDPSSSPESMIDIISMFFEINAKDKEAILEDFSVSSLYELLKDKNMCRSIGFTYMDLNDNLESFNPNPFSKQHTIFNKKTLRTKSYMNSLLYTTDMMNSINVITKDSKVTNDIYFPNHTDSGDNKGFDIRESFQKGFQSYDLRVDNWVHKTIYLILRVLPYTHDLDINLRHVFNSATTSKEMPLVILRNKGSNVYKVNKKYLNSIDKHIIKKISERDATVNTRGVSNLICYFNTNTVGFILVLSKNGSYKIKYLFKQHHFAKIHEIANSFDIIAPFLKSIDDVNLHIMNKQTNIFNSPFIEVSDYTTHTVVSLLDKKIDASKLISNLKKANLVFDLISRDTNIIMLKFKEVSNFFNVDSVSNLIYKNRELSDTELIELIQETFNLSSTEAESELAEKRTNININYTKKGKNIFAIRDYHTSVSVKLNIMSDSAIRVITTNTQHLKYVERLIMYIIYMSLQDITNMGNNKSKSDKPPTESSNERTTFEDILENYDEDFDLSAFDDLGLDDDIDERPSIHRETDVDGIENDEEDFDHGSNTVSKHDYTTHVLKKLQAADPVLFKWTPANTVKKTTNYSGKCGAVNYRQPIVISKSEKENIDKQYPNSYTGYVQTGSTEELLNKNYYICPKIWCRVSRISMSAADLKKYNDKCPTGEEPLFFPKKGTEPEKNYFMNRLGKEIHYPILMDKSKHPLNLSIPCCGKVIPKKMTKNDNAIYISKVSSETILENEKYGVLSEAIDNILNDGMNCVGIIDRTKECFVRTGTDSNLDSLLDVLKKIYDVDDFISYVCDKLSMEEYIFMNQGHTVRTFINEYEVTKIHDVSEFKIFKKAILANKKYILQHNLKKEMSVLKELTSFTLTAPDEHYGTIIRQFLIFRSFTNYKKFLASDVFHKRIDDVIDLVNLVPQPNKNHINILFLEFDESNIYLLNSKYNNIFKTFDFNRNTSIIIKINTKFEFMSKITNKTKQIRFSSVEIAPLLKMIFKENKNIDPPDSPKYENTVQMYVMGMNFKIHGMIRGDSKIIPFRTDEVLQYNHISNKSFIFVDQLTEYQLDWSLKSEFNIDDRMQTELVQKQFNKKYNILNFRVFTHEFTDNHNTNEDTIIYNLTKRIEKNKTLFSAYKILIHDMAHFTMKEKCFILKDFLAKHKIEIDDNLSSYILHKLLTIDIVDFQRYFMNNKLILSDEEVLLTHEDILKGELDNIYEEVFSVLFPQKLSIDDYANTITQIKMDL